jgi:hypothetical protein
MTSARPAIDPGADACFVEAVSLSGQTCAGRVAREGCRVVPRHPLVWIRADGIGMTQQAHEILERRPKKRIEAGVARFSQRDEAWQLHSIRVEACRGAASERSVSSPNQTVCELCR